jgi:hypothetical protein
MRNSKKKILIAILVVVFIIVSVPIFLFGRFVVGTKMQEADGKRLAEHGVEYAKVHLEEKYPNIEYTITDAETEELYNGFTHGGWGDTVEITIDINNEEYKVYANIGNEFAGMCCDNIQADEIKRAIREKIMKMSGIETGYEIELDMTQRWQDYSFYEKYNGDITEFLINEKVAVERYSSTYWEITAHVGYADKEEDFVTTEDDAKFLELFDIVAFVNFKDKVPNTMYSYYTGKSIVEALWDRNIEFNSVWVYNNSAKTFEEVSHNMTRTAVV